MTDLDLIAKKNIKSLHIAIDQVEVKIYEPKIFVVPPVSGSYNWLIGIKRHEHAFRYASNNKRLSYTQWGLNQPSKSEDCVMLQETTLVSVSCSKTSFFMCEVLPTAEGTLSHNILVATGNTDS